MQLRFIHEVIIKFQIRSLSTWESEINFLEMDFRFTKSIDQWKAHGTRREVLIAIGRVADLGYSNFCLRPDELKVI